VNSLASQLALECLVASPGSSVARVGQVALESLVSSSGLPLSRAAQLAMEILYGTTIAAQVVLEALVWERAAVSPPVYPDLIGLGFTVVRRPMFYTSAARSGSGWSVRVSYSSSPTWEWELTYEYLPDYPSQSTASDIRRLLGFYLAMQGDVTPFLFRDPDDCLAENQPLGYTDGSTTSWLVVRSYGIGDFGTEPVGWVDLSQPAAVYVGGVLQDPSTYTFVTTTPGAQQLTFGTAPATGHVVSASFSYMFLVTFRDSTSDFEKFMDRLWQAKKISLASVRG
jgi:uncharacterized protein (TIGR02217 family)